MSDTTLFNDSNQSKTSSNNDQSLKDLTQSPIRASSTKGLRMLTRAHYPFDDSEESDTIIRTVDNVDFYIHRVILSVASVKLKEQLSKLPKPSSDDVSKPVFNVPETSKTIDLLLRFCYPVDDPFISAPMALGNVLEAALKYDIKVAVKILKRLLCDLAKDKPLHVYTIACHLSLEEIASLAAHAWRRMQPHLVDIVTVGDGMLIDLKKTIVGCSYIDEMADISAGAFYRLTQFVRAGVETSFCEYKAATMQSQTPSKPAETAPLPNPFSSKTSSTGTEPTLAPPLSSQTSPSKSASSIFGAPPPTVSSSGSGLSAGAAFGSGVQSPNTSTAPTTKTSSFCWSPPSSETVSAFPTNLFGKQSTSSSATTTPLGFNFTAKPDSGTSSEAPAAAAAKLPSNFFNTKSSNSSGTTTTPLAKFSFAPKLDSGIFSKAPSAAPFKASPSSESKSNTATSVPSAEPISELKFAAVATLPSNLFNSGQSTSSDATATPLSFSFSGSTDSETPSKVPAAAAATTSSNAPPSSESNIVTSVSSATPISELKFATYNSLFNFDDSDLAITSSDGVKFKVHHLIVRLAAPTMVENVKVDIDGKKTLALQEDSRIVSILLQGCYPSITIESGLTTKDISTALAAAARYGMKKVVDKLIAMLKFTEATEALSVYIALARNNFTDEAVEISRSEVLLNSPLSSLYVPEMEEISAQLYYHLLQYRHACLSTMYMVNSKFEREQVKKAEELKRLKKDSFSGPMSLKQLQEESAKFTKEIDGFLSKEDGLLKLNLTTYAHTSMPKWIEGRKQQSLAIESAESSKA